MDLDRAHRIARERGTNPIVYWTVRAVLQPFFWLYFRFRRIGTEHIPAEGPVLLACNHRSFSDPFFLGLCLRRPLRFVAKIELFDKRWKARLLLALGAIPIRRGESDEEGMETARIILEQGGAVGIFPEGTRVRPGPLAEPKRGVGRLALETGAPVVPVAIIGTEEIRKGWRIRPRRVRIRCGHPLTFPRPADGTATARLASEITARIWPCVQLQWEWLGGVAPIRTAAVVGAGSWGTAVAALLAGAGVSVQLGCRNADHAAILAEHRRNDRYLPGVAFPDAISPKQLADLDLAGVDLVCLAVPSRGLMDVVDEIADRLPDRAAILVMSKGLVPDGARLPCDYVLDGTGKRPIAFLAGPAHAAEAADGDAGLVVASTDASFAARLERAFGRAGVECERSSDLVGVQLASCAKNATALAAAVALERGLNAAGAVAGRVYAECHELARTRGAKPDTFVGLAGAGDLVATVLASQSRNRRAGELLAAGATAESIEQDLGQTAEGLDLVPLLASAMREAGIKAPATGELAELIESRRQRAPSQLEGRRAEPAGVA